MLIHKSKNPDVSRCKNFSLASFGKMDNSQPETEPFLLANVQRGNELRTLHFLILPFRASELQRNPANSLGKMVILWFLRRVVTDA